MGTVLSCTRGIEMPNNTATLRGCPLARSPPRPWHTGQCFHFLTPSLMYAEKFGTSFALIKADIGGNISRLETARRKDPAKYAELFTIVKDEIDRKEQSGKYSDTKALLWLKR